MKWIHWLSLPLLFALFLLLLTQPWSMNSRVSFQVKQSSWSKVFLFAGYVGCTLTCPTELGKMTPIMKEFSSDSVGFAFLNLKAPQDFSAQEYAELFHKDMLGLEGVNHPQLLKDPKLPKLNPDPKADPKHPPAWFFLEKSENDWKLRAFNSNQNLLTDQLKWVKSLLQ